MNEGKSGTNDERHALNKILEGAAVLRSSDQPHLKMLGQRIDAITRSLEDSVLAPREVPDR